MSKRACITVLTLCGALVGCGPVVDIDAIKAQVDLSVMKSGIAVTLAGDLGTVTVPFATPLPEASDAELQTTLQRSVDLVVSSPRTGVSVRLADATLVAETPRQAGEVTWKLSDDRAVATLTFFNVTPQGESLERGWDYSVALTIADNDFIEAVPAVMLNVNIQ